MIFVTFTTLCTQGCHTKDPFGTRKVRTHDSLVNRFDDHDDEGDLSGFALKLNNLCDFFSQESVDRYSRDRQLHIIANRVDHDQVLLPYFLIMIYAAAIVTEQQHGSCRLASLWRGAIKIENKSTTIDALKSLLHKEEERYQRRYCALLQDPKAKILDATEVSNAPPQPRLVGIELNPGPPKPTSNEELGVQADSLVILASASHSSSFCGSSTTSPASRLYSDLLHYLFPFLSFRTPDGPRKLIEISRTCRMWYHSLQSCHSLKWRLIGASNIRLPAFKILGPSTLQHHVVSLSVDHNHPTQANWVSIAQWNMLSELKNLTQVQVGVEDKILDCPKTLDGKRFLILMPKKLQKMDISWISFQGSTRDDSIQRQFLEEVGTHTTTTLRSLQINRINQRKSLDPLKELKQLTSLTIRAAASSTVLAILSQLPLLTHLNLVPDPHSLEPSSFYSCPPFPSLRTLVLDQQDMSYQLLDALSATDRFPALSTLSPESFSSDITPLLNMKDRLRELTIPVFSSLISGARPFKIVSELQQLMKLHVEHDISAWLKEREDWIHLFAKLTKLNSLSLVARNITPSDWMHFLPVLRSLRVKEMNEGNTWEAILNRFTLTQPIDQQAPPLSSSSSSSSFSAATTTSLIQHTSLQHLTYTAACSLHAKSAEYDFHHLCVKHYPSARTKAAFAKRQYPW